MNQPTSVADALKYGIPVLASAGIESARFDAQLLLAWAIDGRREDLAMSPERVLTQGEAVRFEGGVRRRSERKPLPYITGEAPFYGRFFHVDNSVLIPRPETELIVDMVRAHHARWGDERPFRIADIGTGSGCIAVTIACEIDSACIVATDISRAALQVAGENAVRHGVSSRLDMRAGSLCEPIATSESFDAIVSNPPYIEIESASSLMPEVRDYEPAWALYGVESMSAKREATGLPRRIRRALLEQAKGRLASGGLLAVEIGAGQADEALDDAARIGYRGIDIVADHAGIGRILTALA